MHPYIVFPCPLACLSTPVVLQNGKVELPLSEYDYMRKFHVSVLLSLSCILCLAPLPLTRLLRGGVGLLGEGVTDKMEVISSRQSWEPKNKTMENCGGQKLTKDQAPGC